MNLNVFPAARYTHLIHVQIPCARSGHAAAVVKNELFVYGGEGRPVRVDADGNEIDTAMPHVDGDDRNDSNGTGTRTKDVDLALSNSNGNSNHNNRNSEAEGNENKHGGKLASTGDIDAVTPTQEDGEGKEKDTEKGGEEGEHKTSHKRIVLGDFFVYNADMNTWREVALSPNPGQRRGHTMTVLPPRDDDKRLSGKTRVLLMFGAGPGGKGGDMLFDSMYLLTIGRCTYDDSLSCSSALLQLLLTLYTSH